jgi:hypothetical protein
MRGAEDTRRGDAASSGYKYEIETIPSSADTSGIGSQSNKRTLALGARLEAGGNMQGHDVNHDLSSSETPTTVFDDANIIGSIVEGKAQLAVFPRIH